MELFTLGIDLGKTTFHLVGMNQRGEVVLRKRFSRTQTVALFREPEGGADGCWKHAEGHVFWGERCESRGMRCARVPRQM